ncbi:hypothetical protein BMIN_0691 [Bifidobacterium minimum]|uniref:CRISPR-associated Cse2 family protein n=2 Tax=Bifidobacterium minimum TaxID=1693 RepID=A0A087BPM9_9BIFI|nr:type I-E CRISPR-associated protein Cse2/CasB [Bifidobacterium minimum]KFI72979.1 hypothetical protein BMIN_0691 [Bifidobacterium minimum]
MAHSTKSGRPQLDEFGTWVASRASLLANGGVLPGGTVMKGYLANGSYATASIAKLRHCVGHEIGEDPSVFPWTLEGIPRPDDAHTYGHEDASKEENAAYVALTLFGLHQQSIHDLPMHTDGNVSLGRAVGQLAAGNPNEAGIRRRFDQLQTDRGWPQVYRHAQGLIRLLKKPKIALNYGLLAQDFVQLESGGSSANAVRLRWGRDFIFGSMSESVDSDGDGSAGNA